MMFADDIVLLADSAKGLCTYQYKAPLPYIRAVVGERWGMVGESTTNLPPGSGDSSLYIILLN